MDASSKAEGQANAKKNRRAMIFFSCGDEWK